MSNSEPVVIIDNGSGIIKAGTNATDAPTIFLPNVLGEPNPEMSAGLLPGLRPRGKEIGEAALSKKGLLKLRYPMTHGIVDNWDDMEDVWYHLYSCHLEPGAENLPVILTEAPMNPHENRTKMVEFFLEKLQVPKVYVGVQATLAIFSTGSITGVVLDIGDGVTHAVPVYEGYTIRKAVQRIDFAGRDLTSYMHSLMLETKYKSYFNGSSGFELSREIKEQYCHLSATPPPKFNVNSIGLGTAARRDETFSDKYRLPDGKVIKLGSELRQCPEALFRPNLCSNVSRGVQQVLYDAINACDSSMRYQLYQNIVVSGGSSRFVNFNDRLHQELGHLYLDEHRDDGDDYVQNNNDINDIIKIENPESRQGAVWNGARVLSELSAFQAMWITKEEYEDNPNCIFQRL